MKAERQTTRHTKKQTDKKPVEFVWYKMTLYSQISRRKHTPVIFGSGYLGVATCFLS